MASCLLFKKSKSCFIDFQYDPEKDEAGYVRNLLLIVATLIAAVTFQAGVNPPGGVWQDNKDHVAGTAIYASQTDPFYVFLVFNTLALSTSVLVIMSLTYNFPFHLEVFIAAASMLVTYGSAIFAVTPHESHKFRYVLTAAAFPFVLRVLIFTAKFKANQGKETSGNSEDNSRRKNGSEIPKNSEGA